MTIMCLWPQFAGSVEPWVGRVFLGRGSVSGGGVRFSEPILFQWRILLKSTCAAMEWRLLGLSRLLGLPSGWERGPADLFAPVPGRDDGVHGLGSGQLEHPPGFLEGVDGDGFWMSWRRSPPVPRMVDWSGAVSEERGLTGDLVPFLGSSLPGLLLIFPVSLGAGLAPGLILDGRVFAVPALSVFLGLLPSLLLVATAIGRPVWVLVSGLFVPFTVLLGSILHSLVRDSASRRIPCCCSAASEGFLRASGGLLYFLAGAG